MTRFQRLAAATVVAAFVLVVIGVAVRATNSGEACPTWPGCFPGQFLPSLASDYHVWIEWTHRTVAALIGFLILGMAALAVLDHRDRRSILWPSIAAFLLVGFQAYLGQETVRLGNSGASVTAHLATAMALVGLLVYLLVRASYPARLHGGGSQRFTLLAAFASAATFALLLFGSNVTAQGAGLVFPDWPLMNGSILPAAAGSADVEILYGTHELHRYVAAIVFVILAAVAWVAWRARAASPRQVRLARLSLAILAVYAVQVAVGGLQVLTQLAPWTQTLHVALGALVWGGTVALATAAYYEARIAAPSANAGEIAAPPGTPGSPGPRETIGESIRAYVALTKPRIIELLLVTTVPAMVLATRDVPGMPIIDWARLTFWTLVCGTLAAGSANAINQYLERDIDQLMVRTRRRPLPASAVTPERAVVFGIALGAISVGLMAWTVNLLAAFLTLLAIGFYVIVYTVMLKRSTPSNIVIGGAAGALPPVIGWAAVTGNVALPALLLFLIVFYWTPPHFWALALRIRGDYAAAGVPMLPVVRGIAETSRQIGLYTILLVALTIVFAVVARMGAIYAIAAVILGVLFLWRAYVLWRQGTSPEASTAQAIRLYRYSITYLTILFAAVALDTVVRV
ncbi:MAG TPA: heme o synthase [Candidatus Dormibacteraeota bacterium]|nr:heme o synthase [Candidatus Dormibacteraeota bacterium]